jgi:hypothetical protein
MSAKPPRGLLSTKASLLSRGEISTEGKVRKGKESAVGKGKYGRERKVQKGKESTEGTGKYGRERKARKGKESTEGKGKYGRERKVRKGKKVGLTLSSGSVSLLGVRLSKKERVVGEGGGGMERLGGITHLQLL